MISFAGVFARELWLRRREEEEGEGGLKKKTLRWWQASIGSGGNSWLVCVSHVGVLSLAALPWRRKTQARCHSNVSITQLNRACPVRHSRCGGRDLLLVLSQNKIVRLLSAEKWRSSIYHAIRRAGSSVVYLPYTVAKNSSIAH